MNLQMRPDRGVDIKRAIVRTWLALGLSATALSACMYQPYDGWSQTYTFTEIAFDGFDIKPATTIIVVARKNSGGTIGIDASESSVTPEGTSSDGYELYPWHAAGRVPEYCWTRSVEPGTDKVIATAKVKAYRAYESQDLFSVEKDYFTCWNAGGASAEAFASNCASDHDPWAVLTAHPRPNIAYTIPASSVMLRKGSSAYLRIDLNGTDLARPDTSGFTFDDDVSVYYRRSAPTVTGWNKATIAGWGAGYSVRLVTSTTDNKLPGKLDFKVVVRGMGESNIITRSLTIAE